MSFVRRKIEVSVKLAADTQMNQPSTFSDGSDTITVKDARASVRIQNSGAPSNAAAQVDVYGLKQSLMNQLSTLGMQINLVPKNTIVVRAGDEETGMVNVFSGTITAAYGDYEAAPNVPMHMECLFGADLATLPAVATSYTGAASVATIMQDLATKMGLGFENNGVTASLERPALRGSLIQQLQSVRDDAGINAEIVDGVLCIFPKYGSRATPQPPLISKDTGMIGYPSYTQQGILVKTVFNPQVAFFKLIKVKSSVVNPDNFDTFTVMKLDHALDSQVPRGHWMSTIYGYNPNNPHPVLPPP